MILNILFIISLILVGTAPYYYFLATSLKLRILFTVLLLVVFFSQKVSSFVIESIKKLEKWYKLMDYKYFTLFFIIFSFFFLYGFVVDHPIGDFHGYNFGVNFWIPTDEAHDIEYLSIAIPNMVHYTIYYHTLLIWNGVYNLNIPIAPGHVVILLNCLFGAISLLFLLKISREFFSPYGPVFFVFFMFSGFTEMFFGYWEIYTQGLMFTIIFLYYCMKSLSEPKAKVYAAIALGLAIASHSTIITLYAGFFVLIFFNNNLSFKARIKEVCYYSLITFGIFIGLALIFYAGGMIWSYYLIYSTHAILIKTILSLSHYQGIFNQFLITGGLSFMTIILFWIFKKHNEIKDILSYSFLASLMAYLVFMIIYIHSFGYFGVWPLMTAGGALTVVFASWLIKNYCSDMEKIRILALLLIANLFFYIPTVLYDRLYLSALF